jgi:hypothetical protein
MRTSSRMAVIARVRRERERPATLGSEVFRRDLDRALQGSPATHAQGAAGRGAGVGSLHLGDGVNQATSGEPRAVWGAAGCA